MALAARDIPVTREMVAQWIEAWDDDSDTTLEDWIRAKVAELDLEDEMVNTTAHDNLPDEVHIADMIISDLPSYLLSEDDASDL